MIHVRRRDNETSAALLRRFTRKVQQAGILIHTRKMKFHSSSPNKRVLRERALRRIRRKKEQERLEKLGKGPE